MRTIRLTNPCPLKGVTMGVRPALLAVLFLALLLACTGPAFSQITVAQLNGFVHDESGGAVKNATLTLRGTATNAGLSHHLQRFRSLRHPQFAARHL